MGAGGFCCHVSVKKDAAQFVSGSESVSQNSVLRKFIATYAVCVCGGGGGRYLGLFDGGN
jgi:hypothetical protein